jgi:drug/metabolite transporter (DMT)-like permease
MSMIAIAILAGLGGMFGWGLADFFAKKTIDRLGDVQSLAWAGVFGTCAFGVVAYYRTAIMHGAFTPPQDGLSWFLLLILGALQAMVYLFAYKGFGKGQLALLNPIFSSFSGIVALLSILFLGEIATSSRMIVLAIVFLGVLIISIDFRAVRSRKITFTRVPGFLEIMIATALAAIWTILWAEFVRGKDAIAFATYMFFFMTLTAFGYAYYCGLPMRVRSLQIWFWLALIGISETLAYLAITIGYGATPYTSVVAILSGGFSLPTIILARLYLRERLLVSQWVGCAVIIFGVMLLPLV